MSSSGRDIRLSYGQHFICTSLAGIAAKTLTAPLDVVKIRTQVGSPEAKNGLVFTVKSIYKSEGIRALWKGNLVGCMRVIPYSLFQVLFFRQLKILLVDRTGRLTTTTALIAGSGAGLLATLVLYPTDVLKTRLVVQNNKIKDLTIGPSLKSIFQKEKVSGLYKGVLTSVLGSVPYAASVFLFYEIVDNTNIRKSFHTNSLFYILACGCLSSFVAQTMSFPFDTARKILQAQCYNFKRHERLDIYTKKLSIVFIERISSHGIKGMWQGALVNTIRVVPYTSMLFLVYEVLKGYFLYSNGYTNSPVIINSKTTVDPSLDPDELEEYFEEYNEADEYT